MPSRSQLINQFMIEQDRTFYKRNQWDLAPVVARGCAASTGHAETNITILLHTQSQGNQSFSLPVLFKCCF